MAHTSPRVFRGTMRRATLAAFREAISAAAAATSRWGGSSASAHASRARWAPPRARVAQNHQWRSLGSSAPSRAAQPRGGAGGGKPGGARGVGAADGARAGTGKKPFKKGTAAKGLPDRFAGLLEDERDDGDATETTTKKAFPNRAASSSSSDERTKRGMTNDKASSDDDSKAALRSSRPPPIELAANATVAELAKKLSAKPERVERILAELGEPVASAEDAVGSADLVELVALELGAENVKVVDAPKSKSAHRKGASSSTSSARVDGARSSSSNP